MKAFWNVRSFSKTNVDGLFHQVREFKGSAAGELLVDVMAERLDRNVRQLEQQAIIDSPETRIIIGENKILRLFLESPLFGLEESVREEVNNGRP